MFNKKADEIRRLLSFLNRFPCLDRLDVFRSWSLWSLSLIERHSLSFLEIVIAHPFEIRTVEKHVLTVPQVDETKTFVCQLFDCTFCHLQSDS